MCRSSKSSTCASTAQRPAGPSRAASSLHRVVARAAFAPPPCRPASAARAARSSSRGLERRRPVRELLRHHRRRGYSRRLTAPDSVGRRETDLSPPSPRRSPMPIPTEMVGSLPRPMKLQEAYEAYDQGQIGWEDLQAEQDAAAEDSIKRLEATGAGRRHRRRAARVELRHLPDHRHARGHRARRQPRRRRPVLRDLRRRPPPPAPAADRRPVPLQDLRLGVRREEQADRHARRQAGGDRAVDADAPVSARGRDRGLLARRSSSPTCATRWRRTSASASPRVRCASRSTSRRAGWPTRTTAATRGPARTCCRSSSTSTTACSIASARRSGSTSASTRARAATATRCTPRRSPTRSC